MAHQVVLLVNLEAYLMVPLAALFARPESMLLLAQLNALIAMVQASIPTKTDRLRVSQHLPE